MTLTKPQQALLRSIYDDAQNDDDRMAWTEPAVTDKVVTLRALARKGMLEIAPDGLFRMTDASITLMSNKDFAGPRNEVRQEDSL